MSTNGHRRDSLLHCAHSCSKRLLPITNTHWKITWCVVIVLAVDVGPETFAESLTRVRTSGNKGFESIRHGNNLSEYFGASAPGRREATELDGVFSSLSSRRNQRNRHDNIQEYNTHYNSSLALTATAVKGGPRLMQFDFHQRNASAQNFTALELILPITSKNMKYRSRLLQRACVSVARVTTCSKVKGTLRFRTSDNNQEIVYDLRGILPNSQKNVFTIFVRFSKDVFPAKVIHRPVLVLSNRNPSPISLPRLQSHIYTARESRTKRELSENGGCRRVSWSVHVKDLGWLGVVVTPTTFTIGYCVGKCTLDTTSKFTNNAQIRAQYIRLLGNAKVSVPAPCCVPIQYSPVTVWYVKDGSIVQEVAPEMDVIECGCL